MSNLIDVAFLASYYKSSRSDWEKYRVGSPIDGAAVVDRYSVHTEKEHDPFVVFEIPLPFKINSIRINFRYKYVKKSLPVKILGLSIGEWIDIGVVSVAVPSANFDVERQFSKIKITTSGFKSLDFSSINIFVEKEEFKKSIRVFSEKMGGVVYAHTDFYGLGGKLSVLASALGYLGAQSYQKNIVCDKSLEKVLAYPSAYKEGQDTILDDKLNEWVGKSLLEFIKNKKYSGDRNVSRYYPILPDADQLQKFTFISRNKLDRFSYSDENPVLLKQRMYKRMIPSTAVLDLKEKIKRNFSFEGNRSIGLHLRHGNGELYYREFEDFNRWGVKPPDFQVFIESVKKILDADPLINKIIVCSDSFAVKKIISKNLGEKVEVLFVSENIQDVGCGCNHTPKVFNKNAERKRVDRSMEDCVALSEMLILAECSYLVGGSSFFFDAVIGFSECAAGNVIQIENKDRYARLNKNVVPVQDCDDKDIKSKLVSSPLLLDGVFVCNDGRKVILSYFDEEVKTFRSKKEFLVSSLEEVELYLKERRGY